MSFSHTKRAKALLETVFEENEARYIDEWKEFLRFPSVSADPDHEPHCLACAEWLKAHLGGMGLSSRLIETSGKPLVFAQTQETDPDWPTVLFYGHYDVQPADPLDRWVSPPFEPSLRNGRLYARGAQDNKGQLFYFLKAAETLIRRGELKLSLKALIEGEEESGCAGITAALPQMGNRIKADALMVSDSAMDRSGAPAIIAGLRGMIHLTVELHGPGYDLHSGSHEGLAPNPAQAMARLLAGLHRADGSIAVDGFCDAVSTPDQREMALALANPFDEEAYMSEVGTPPAGGEKGLPPQVRTGFRPTIEINGISSGYSGRGTKTIIPSVASAKITARLVPDQDPDACLEKLIRHLETNAPEGLRLSIGDEGSAGRGFRLDVNSPVFAKAASVLEAVCGRKPVYHWEGASIPIVNSLREASGAEALLVGFGTQQDKIHAPNESFSIEQFRTGYLYSALMLSALMRP